MQQKRVGLLCRFKDSPETTLIVETIQIFLRNTFCFSKTSRRVSGGSERVNKRRFDSGKLSPKSKQVIFRTSWCNFSSKFTLSMDVRIRSTNIWDLLIAFRTSRQQYLTLNHSSKVPKVWIRRGDNICRYINTSLWSSFTKSSFYQVHCFFVIECSRKIVHAINKSSINLRSHKYKWYP